MPFDDRTAALLACAVYYEKADKEMRDKNIPPGWKKKDVTESADSGLFCMWFTKDEGSENGGLSCFSIMGTGSTAGKDVAKGQLKSNTRLREDPEENMDIIDEAVQYIEGRIADSSGKGGSMKHYVVGHSLGGATASCTMVALHDKLERCITFESPGMIRHWREKSKGKGDDYWQDKIKEYVSFPNPINTALPHVGSLYRLHMVMQAKASPGHVIRCAVGSGLRLVVWVSLANVAFAAAGRAQGFWAAKLGSVTCKFAQLIFARKFTPGRIKQAFQEGIKYDQASKDSRAAAEGRVDDPGAKPLMPVLKAMPEKARPAFIVGFWAIAAAAFANTGYVSMRTLAQINDCMAEHSIDTIAQHFDDETGDAKCATKMDSWPYHALMIQERLPAEHFRRSILEGMTPFHKTAYGLHNLLNREKVLLRRASTMPGFAIA